VFSFERSADLLLVLVIGGTGYLYGGLIGAVVFKLLQDMLATWTPQYWQFWIGLILVILVLIGRERMHRWAMWLPDRLRDVREARAKKTNKKMDKEANNAAGKVENMTAEKPAEGGSS
jgi:branched-chain amino acid transport system permease protein